MMLFKPPHFAISPSHVGFSTPAITIASMGIRNGDSVKLSSQPRPWHFNAQFTPNLSQSKPRYRVGGWSGWSRPTQKQNGLISPVLKSNQFHSHSHSHNHMTAKRTLGFPPTLYRNQRSLSTQVVIPTITPPSDPGLRQFLGRVYSWTGVGIFGTVGLATVLAPLGLNFFPYLVGGGLALSLGSCLGVTMIKPEIKTTTSAGREILYAEDKPLRKASYIGLITGMGLGLTPLMHMILAIDPLIVPISLGLTTTIFGGCWWYSRRCSDLQMMQWQAPLMIGLGTLVAGGLMSIGSTLILGPNLFSSLWMNVDMYGGIVLFTAMTIYDMYMAEKMYRERNPDHLGCATSIYLDFINMLIRIMEVLGKAKSK
jgi:FtsH-binding integral membrane protein